MIILDGKATSIKIETEISKDIESRLLGTVKPPRLDVIIVGDDYGSKKYVQMKKKTAEKLGFISVVHELDASTSQADILSLIQELNIYEDVTGIMVQLPLPADIDTNAVVNAVDSDKDVDGLTAYNLGLAYQGEDTIVSATPRGILLLLEEYEIDVKGKDVVIVGWGKSVGIPLLGKLTSMGATVTICHDLTTDLASKTSQAEILISATGVSGLVKAEHVKEGAIVIDVGISMNNEGKISGDVDVESIREKVSAISPVPGGVGPMTVASLMLNTYEAWVKGL